MQEYPYSTWYCFGSADRQSLCRSPGSDPAAQITTPSSPAASLTAPTTSDWAGFGVWPRWWAASTAASQSRARATVRARCSWGTCQPASAAVSASRAVRASATIASPACLTASGRATLMLRNRTPGSANWVCEAVVKSL